ncbi:amino acid/amide ABC transporter substrate-binding protein, HAAT family [Celeribacter neptunius]|uniref:Amino acid/amide ABC transporter substrate-binding protein, HAAT family n=2 Tax=Celeribacter neptunius TaxID=588602 RepID=A0A1I3UGN8_9RHOB|nr:amino acid/amide ABC transporter substrate-binding protein, HAAT family [Celeribacter neptunius]
MTSMAAMLAATIGATWATGAAALDVSIGYLRFERPPHAVLSNLDPIPERRGIEGAELALGDNRTTGKFLGHDYGLEVISVPFDGDIFAAARAMEADHDLILLDMAAKDMLAIVDAAPAGTLFFNVGSRDPALRDSACRAQLLHAIPSLAIEADALMQVLLAKGWNKLAMIEGPTPQDKALAETYRKSVQKFGLKIVSEASWSFDTDLRRAASREVPLLTQAFKPHDVVLIADAHGDFARYIEHNTWQPRPVAGASGLEAVAWAPVVEQWGAAQLQSRFEHLSGREMTPEDYAAWAAMRTIGEAVTRLGQTDPAELRDYILSDAFELAGFQGRPLSYRHWNGQMRQPIPVVNAHAQVASAPLDGFEHARNPLDTLGIDLAESRCSAFGD